MKCNQSFPGIKLESPCPYPVTITITPRYAINFCFKLGKNAKEMYRMLQTPFGTSCTNRASVFKWHKRFKKGREFVRDDERCGSSKEVSTLELIG